MILQCRSSGRAWCALCGAEWELIALEDTNVISNLERPTFEEWLNSGELHGSQAADGSTLICLNSRLALTLKTRRGTGYYKVPSLKGVWYRSMFGHSGWCATLDDWFDPRRTRDDYVPTGFKPYGVKTYAVKGHPFGLELSAEDKRALIAFLRTL
jgi:hypothetical protein